MSAVLVTGLTEGVSEHALREFFSYRRVRSPCSRLAARQGCARPVPHAPRAAQLRRPPR